MNKKKSLIVISCMLLAMYLTIENTMSVMLTGMAGEFPNASITTIQQVISIVMLVELPVNFIAGKLAEKLSKRKIVIIFQGGTVLGGLIGYFFGKTLGVLFFSSVIIGVSAGIISTIAKSIITENFTPEEVPKMIAAQQICQSVGSIIMNIAAGHLAAAFWRNGYLTFLFGLLSFITALFMLPEGPLEVRRTDEKTGTKQKIWTKSLVHDVLTTLFYLCFFYGYYYNIGFVIQEKGFGNSSITGYMSSILMAANFIAAIMLSRFTKLTKNLTLTICYILTVAGFLTIAFSSSLPILIFGVILVGYGQGTFTPYVYTTASLNSDPSVITSSIAMVNAGAAIGMYLFPYVVTWPLSFITNSASTRFVATSVFIVILGIAELIYIKNDKAPLEKKL